MMPLPIHGSYRVLTRSFIRLRDQRRLPLQHDLQTPSSSSKARLSTSASSAAIPTTPMAEVDVRNSHGENDDDANALQQRIADALRPHYVAKRPCVLRGAANGMPAIRKWSEASYLKEAHKNGTAQIEIGGSYTTPGVERPEIPIADYFLYLEMFEQQYGATGPTDDLVAAARTGDASELMQLLRQDLPPKEHLVYMAQNELPDYLHNDIVVPQLCTNDSFGIGNGRLYQTMWWLGPRGCVSPLHHDPLDNLLLQIRGRKRFVCADPIQNKTMWHYAGTDQQQSNTSPVNVEQISPSDEKQYPLFHEHAPFPFEECIVHPGDIIFIPSKWWHQVRSIDMSTSVNVWWR